MAPTFRKELVGYIERCHLEDGGYFFVPIPPSSGLDTFFAIKSLSILGVKPIRPQATAEFFFEQKSEGALESTTGIYAAVEVLKELGLMTDEIKRHARQKITPLQNISGGFGALGNIDVEVASELEQTYRAIKVLKTIGAEFAEGEASRFVSCFSNADGGYGSPLSTLASTFYATGIIRLLHIEGNRLFTSGLSQA